jgi:hypothetical protein
VSQERTLRDVALGLSVLTEPEGFLRSSGENSRASTASGVPFLKR